MSYNLGNVKGSDGKGIQSITKTATSGLVDTYTITYTDGTTQTFGVTNGSSGADIVTSWESTPSDSKVASEKLTKDTLDTKASNNHRHGNLSNDGKIGSSSGKIIVTGTSGLLAASDLKTINNNNLIGSGNIDIQGGGSVDIVTSWESTLSDTKVPSEKLTKNTIDGLNIPTKISDLTNDSDFIETSATTGLIKNDGTVMTSGTGSTNYSAGNHTHSGYVSATKVTSWSGTVSDSNIPSEKLVKDSLDGKASSSHTHASTAISDDNSEYPHIHPGLPSTPNSVHDTLIDVDSAIGDLQDLIGDAITYINQ